MKLAITVLIFLCLFKTIASLFSSGGVLHEDDILTVAEFRRHHRSRDGNFPSDKIEQNTNFRIQKGGVDDDDGNDNDDDDEGNEWQTDVHIGSKLSGFAELSRDENYQDDENMGHQQHHQQQHHHSIDGAAARRPYDRSFYDDNYAVEDAPSTSTSDESFLNDLPQGKKLEPPFVYSRRQVPSKLLYTKEITIKQGRVKGIVRNMYPQSGLRDVDQFLGLPYAEPPVGSNRFMPPGAPPPWQGLKIASHLPSVCPQNIPDLSKSNLKLSKGRMDQLNRLLPYLKHESEDCLYLNVYVPKSDGLEMSHKYPVIVYIHGESYEWNSGNPYDGSVLASYGQVIVVTINYRLGVLGFMKPGISDNTPSNFGLLDQIAALQWVKDNIAAFGGDSSIVTLMGHGTGAACANFLMVSPIANGLFHRAILMSGSAMSDWATANHSLQITMQIAHGLNCPQTDENEEMLNCLRKKRYQEILKIPASTPQFSTSFGPIVDGSVIRNQPYKDMGTYTDLFSRYDLLFGVTEVESYHTLTAQALQEGLRENERDNLLRFYMQNRFEIRPDLALAATLKKYTEIYNNPVQATMHEHRDAVLDIISDARVVAPVVQTGIFHAKVNPRSYMYVFAHNSEAGAYANLQHSITGEELAFVFGAPLAPAGPFHLKYSTQERLLSEAVMLYWTNFAKTGNPKAPWRDSFLTLHALEWERYDIDWPDFNTRNQCYVNIGIPPSLGFRYRNIYMNFWNKELPDELNQIATIQPQPYYHYFPPSPTQLPRRGTSTDPNDIIRGHLARFPPTRKVDPTKDSIRTLKILLQEQLETADNMYNAQPTFGASTENTNAIPETDDHEGKEIIKSESTIHILVGVVVLFLIFNIIIALTYVMKKKKKNSPFNRKLGILSYDGTTDDELKRSKNNDGDDSYILDIVRKSNTYEAVKTNRSGNSPINGFKVTRQLSTSTVDAHTKVCDWISQDLAKCSPKSSKKSSPSFSLKGRSFLRRPRKISVAIDATPQARSSSILRQEPIEVTKLKTTDTTRNNIIICQEVEVDAELLNPECLEPVITTTHRRGSTSSMQERRQGLRIDHKHSRSDPVDMYYTMSANDEKVTSFIDSDVNVTSRDEGDEEKDPLSPEEQLQNIKRRNFPKVLPDYPNDDESFSTVAKRKSLSSFNFPSFQGMRVPPAPPPRTVTTPNRRPYSNRRQSNNITTSPLMLAEDYPEEDEPEIAKNTLIVGPLLPKSQESIYCTVNRRKQCNSGENLNSPPSNTDPDTKPTKPSGIKPPSAFSSLPTKPPTISTETLPQSRLEPKIIIKPSPPKAAATAAAIPRSNIPRVHVAHDSTSRIPHLKTPSLSSLDRDKSTPESSSSDTSSSTGTVKTELKQN